MIHAILYSIVGFVITVSVTGVLAHFLLRGANMEKVGEIIGFPAGLVGATIGFVFGIARSRKIQRRRLAGQATAQPPPLPTQK